MRVQCTELRGWSVLLKYKAGGRHLGVWFGKLTVKQWKNRILGPREKEGLLVGSLLHSCRLEGTGPEHSGGRSARCHFSFLGSVAE